MAVMLIIMMLPAFGLALFYFWPLASALPMYLVLLAFSGFFHVLMMKSKRRYVGTGPEALVGAPATVLSWKGSAGQVRLHGEIWRARSKSEAPATRDDVVHVVEVEGLTLIVERRPGSRGSHDSQRAPANVPPPRGRRDVSLDVSLNGVEKEVTK